MREFDVTDDSPQNHIAPMTIQISVRPSADGSAWVRIWMKGLALSAVVRRSGMASVTARSIT